MRRSVSTAASAALLTLVAAALIAHEPTPAANDADAAVREVLLRNARGFENGDLPMVDGLWAHDAGVTVFESGHANYGWEDYRDNHLRPEIEEMKNVRYRLTDVKTHVDGKTAWATFKYTISAKVGEGSVEGGLGTAVQHPGVTPSSRPGEPVRPPQNPRSENEDQQDEQAVDEACSQTMKPGRPASRLHSIDRAWNTSHGKLSATATAKTTA